MKQHDGMRLGRWISPVFAMRFRYMLKVKIIVPGSKGLLKEMVCNFG